MNTEGQVIHDGKIVGGFEYFGSSCCAGTVIYPPDSYGTVWHTRQDKIDSNKCTCGQSPVQVKLWVEYAGGFYWNAHACLTCKAITDHRFHDQCDFTDTIDGHPLGPEFETEYAKDIQEANR